MNLQDFGRGCWPITQVQRYIVLMVFTMLHMATTTYSTRMHNIHWNSSNPLFRIDRNDNVIDINGGNHPWEYDQVNIVCPVYNPGDGSTRQSGGTQEQYIIYSVTEQEYESCRITQPNPKIIAVCNRPYEQMYFTITFRSFTPTPGGLEFRPGHSYYFISTSSKNDLHRRVGGGCSTHNMKITFKVADDYSNTVEDYSKEDNSLGGGQSSSDSTLQSPVVIQNKPGATGSGSGGETFYYPTSEVEDAGYFHHKQSHHEAQAPWLAASKATSSWSKIPATTYLVMHFLLAISVLQWVVTL